MIERNPFVETIWCCVRHMLEAEYSVNFVRDQDRPEQVVRTYTSNNFYSSRRRRCNLGIIMRIRFSKIILFRNILLFIKDFCSENITNSRFRLEHHCRPAAITNRQPTNTVSIHVGGPSDSCPNAYANCMACCRRQPHHPQNSDRCLIIRISELLSPGTHSPCSLRACRGIASITSIISIMSMLASSICSIICAGFIRIIPNHFNGLVRAFQGQLRLVRAKQPTPASSYPDTRTHDTLHAILMDLPFIHVINCI